MGLDTVELVMEVEEAFEISIPDDRASRIETVGDLYDFILEKLPSRNPDSTRCLTAALFYELRRHLQMQGEVRVRLRPTTALDEAIPITNRLSTWHALSTEMRLKFPRLGRPPGMVVLMTLVVVVFAITAGVLTDADSRLVQFVVASGVAVMTATLLAGLTQSFAVQPTVRCATIRDLVQYVVSANYTAVSYRYSIHSPTDVWQALQLIIAEQLGVEKSRIVPSARFVQDLGAD